MSSSTEQRGPMALRIFVEAQRERGPTRAWAHGSKHENEWGGVDFTDVTDRTAVYRVLRVVPIDGEFRNGAQVFLMTRSLVVIAQLDARCDATPSLIVALCDALVAEARHAA